MRSGRAEACTGIEIRVAAEAVALGPIGHEVMKEPIALEDAAVRDDPVVSSLTKDCSSVAASSA